jgi:hypothetical protein
MMGKGEGGQHIKLDFLKYSNELVGRDVTYDGER